MKEQIIQLFGTISQYYYGKLYFKYFLDRYKGQPVRVQISSYGGEVGEALAISALFEEHGDVTVEYIGLNASAATFIAFGAKRIEMREDAMWLCHKSMLGIDIYGNLNADKIDEKIKELQTAKMNTQAIDLMIAKKYSDRSGKKIVEVLGLMKQANWMPADKVLEWGFVDAVIPGTNKKAVVSQVVKNCLEAAGFPIPADEVPEVVSRDTAVENKGQESSDSKTMVQQIIDGVKNLFSNKTEENSQTQIFMNKEYVSVNTLLKVEGLEFKEGVITLNEDQIKVINQALQDAEKAKKTAEEALATAQNSLTELVNDLDGLGDGIKNVADNKTKVAVIKAILDKLPGQTTNTNNEASEESKFAAVAVDPINNYDNE